MATPNWKLWLVNWLRAQPGVAAEVSTRVFTKMPASKTYPLIVVQRIAGGPERGYGGSLHDPLFQIDAFAASEGDAHDAAVAAVDALDGLHGRITAGGVTVTVSDVDVGAIHEGWDDTAPTIARTRFSARLWLRP